jgi:hypothetical protein
VISATIATVIGIKKRIAAAAHASSPYGSGKPAPPAARKTEKNNKS